MGDGQVFDLLRGRHGEPADPASPTPATTEILSGILVLGVYNDHLVKSQQGSPGRRF